MMYKLIIVDDEEIVRKGLAKLVDLSGSGFIVAGEAGNGVEGIDLVNSVNPELMIIDVKTPGMTGLEMIDRIKGSYPGIKFIILSGYTDFEYTRHAIRSGAVDYLKKPVNRIELSELLIKAKLELDREKETRQQKERFQELTADLSVIKEKLFQELITGSEMSPQQISKKLTALNIEADLSSTCLSLIMRVDQLNPLKVEPKNETQSLRTEVYNLGDRLRQYFQAELFFGLDHLLTGIIFFKQNPEKTGEELASALNDIIVKGKEMGLMLTVGIGSIVPSLLEIGKSFTEARQALKVSFYRGKGRMYTVSDIKLFPGIDYQLLLERKKPLLDKVVVQLISGGDGVALEAGDALWEDFETKEFSPEDIGKFANSLVEYLAWNLKRNGYQIHLDMEMVSKELSGADTLSDLKESVKYYYNEMKREITSLQTNGERKVVEIAKEFIFANYANNISLEIVAEHIHMNSSYFSLLFKKETGENFIDFVTRVRIEKSKELLHHIDLKIYDICQMVGYHGPKHFARLFKELVGLTPIEYRNKIK